MRYPPDGENTEHGAAVPPGCRASADQLAAWVDGGLQGADARAVTRHVAQCPRCAGEAEELRLVLADLHAAMAHAPAMDRSEAFWQEMAAGIDAAIDQSAAAGAEPSHLFALPARRWRSLAWAASGAFAAAALALLAVRLASPPAVGPAESAAAMAPHWTDALQARMAVDGDPGADDSDPLDDLDDLDDDEVEELATQLGEEG